MNHRSPCPSPSPDFWILVSEFCLSKIFSKIQSCVEAADLFFVAVEFQGWLSTPEEAGTDNALAFLAPAGMVNFRVDVRVETVLTRRRLVPESLRLIDDKVDSDQRFSSLEPIFPRHHQADGRPVLVQQRLP